MSEPLQKGDIDMTSLDQALNDTEAVSDIPSDTLKQQSTTLAQSAKTENRASSPATLSPSSPRSLSPDSVRMPKQTEMRQQQPGVAELKGMFPELDTETINAVLSARGGDQASAVNALLQMSDPDFKPAQHETQTDTDALLAQSIALDEEQKHQERLARQQQPSSGGRGGGGAASFFDGILGSSRTQSNPSSPQNYDPNVLTYQPRVRKPNPAPGSRSSLVAGPSPARVSGPNNEESLLGGLPGPKEAKQWQGEINKMAETGLARAASTFSSLKQKANAAFNAPPGSNAESSTAAGDKTPSFQGFQKANSSYATESKAPAAPRGLRSPRSPNASEYDQDPSPVSENELARLMSRGEPPVRQTSASTGQGAGTKAKALADRYGLGIKKASVSSSTKLGAGAATNAETGQVYHGWDQAGRTPISIKNNTDSPTLPASANKDSVALMDGAQGRGVSSPRKDRSPAKEDASQATVFSATSARHSTSQQDDENDSDDLEYVSNPFEDED